MKFTKSAIKNVPWLLTGSYSDYNIEFGISVYITAQLSISDVHETSLALYVTCKVIIHNSLLYLSLIRNFTTNKNS